MQINKQKQIQMQKHMKMQIASNERAARRPVSNQQPVIELTANPPELRLFLDALASLKPILFTD